MKAPARAGSSATCLHCVLGAEIKRRIEAGEPADELLYCMIEVLAILAPSLQAERRRVLMSTLPALIRKLALKEVAVFAASHGREAISGAPR